MVRLCLSCNQPMVQLHGGRKRHPACQWKYQSEQAAVRSQERTQRNRIEREQQKQARRQTQAKAATRQLRQRRNSSETRPCEHCGGSMFLHADMIGTWWSCVMCGRTDDVQTRPELGTARALEPGPQKLPTRQEVELVIPCQSPEGCGADIAHHTVMVVYVKGGRYGIPRWYGRVRASQPAVDVLDVKGLTGMSGFCKFLIRERFKQATGLHPRFLKEYLGNVRRRTQPLKRKRRR